MANTSKKFNEMINMVNEYFVCCKEMPYNTRNIIDRIRSAYETRSLYTDLHLSYKGEIDSISLEGEEIFSGSSEKTFNLFNLISRGVRSLHKDANKEIDYGISVIEEFLGEKALRGEYDCVYEKVDSFHDFLIGEADYQDVIDVYRS